jgi:hypothetical protein
MRRRARSALRTLALVCTGVALGGGVYGGTVLAEWAIESETFTVKGIRVAGSHAGLNFEVLEAAKTAKGVGVFDIPVGDIERSVSSLPTVKRCFVQRRLPDELIVRVAERRPYFLVNCGCLWRADREGVILGRAQARDLDEMFLVGWSGIESPSGGGRDGPPLEPGTALNREASRRVVEAIGLMRRLAPDLIGTISEICFTDEGELVLFTSDPVHRIVAGTEGLKAESLFALNAVLDDLRRRGLAGTEIDLRFDRQLVVRPCSSSSVKRKK